MSTKKHTNWITKVVSVLLMGIYILSYVGFSIHTCSCEGSSEISVLIGNPSCESLHAHIPASAADHHHCEHSHDEGCCSTEILVMTSDQTSPDNQTLFNALSSCVEVVFHYPELIAQEFTLEVKTENSPHSGNTSRHILSHHSVWRL